MGASYANLVALPRDGETLDDLTKRCTETAERLGGRTHVVPADGYVVCMPESVDGFDPAATAAWSAELSAGGGRAVFVAVFDSDVLAVGLWTDGRSRGEAALPEAWFATEEELRVALLGEGSWRAIAEGLGVDPDPLIGLVAEAADIVLVEEAVDGIVGSLGVVPHAALRNGYRYAAQPLPGTRQRALDSWQGAFSVAG